MKAALQKAALQFTEEILNGKLFYAVQKQPFTGALKKKCQ